MAILLTYGEEAHESEVDRVRLAIVKASEPEVTVESIASNTRVAKADFRDILCWAEYSRLAKKFLMPEGKEKQKIREAERREYEEWLEK